MPRIFQEKAQKRTFVLKMSLNFILACPGEVAKLFWNVLDCSWVLISKCCGHLVAELFNMFLKEYRFPDCLKVSHVVQVFKNIRKRSIARNYCCVSLATVVSKKPLKERLIHQLEKWHFLRFLVWFQVFMCSCITFGSCTW